MLLAVANRPMDTNTTFSTGGDVSRFQRRTVPAAPAPARRGSRRHGRGARPVRWCPTGPVGAHRPRQ